MTEEQNKTAEPTPSAEMPVAGEVVQDLLRLFRRLRRL